MFDEGLVFGLQMNFYVIFMWQKGQGSFDLLYKGFNVFCKGFFYDLIFFKYFYVLMLFIILIILVIWFLFMILGDVNIQIIEWSGDDIGYRYGGQYEVMRRIL